MTPQNTICYTQNEIMFDRIVLVIAFIVIASIFFFIGRATKKQR